jgi:hypothetical protein
VPRDFFKYCARAKRLKNNLNLNLLRGGDQLIAGGRAKFRAWDNATEF